MSKTLKPEPGDTGIASFDPLQTINPFDGVRADGTVRLPAHEELLDGNARVTFAILKQRREAAKKAKDVFEFPKEANEEMTYRVFQPKIEKAKRMTELSMQLEEDDQSRQVEAMDEISDLLDQKRGEWISKRRMYRVILDGVLGVNILLESKLIQINNTNNLIALHHVNGELAKEHHVIDDADLEWLLDIFNDIHPTSTTPSPSNT